MTKLERQPVAVHHLARRVPILDQVQALHYSGLLGHLDVVWFRTGGASDGDASREYIVRTHAGSFRERAEWLRELLVDLNVGG